MRNTKSSSRYAGRSAADPKPEQILPTFAFFVPALWWRALKARPAESLGSWMIGTVLLITSLLPGDHLDPIVIIEFVAKLEIWLWRKFETLHVLQFLLWIALTLATSRQDHRQKKKRRSPPT